MAPPNAVPGQDVGVPAQIANRSMSYLAQSLAVSSARGNPDIGAFSGVMTTLRKACGLMSEGFWEACLDVEVVVQMMLAEATAHDRAFATKATKDLYLWTSALQPLFNTDAVMEAKMEIRCAHARNPIGRPSKTTPKKESAQDKATWQVREEVVHKFQEEEEN